MKEEEEEQGAREGKGRQKHKRKERKEQKRQNIKLGVTARHRYHHLRRKQQFGYQRKEYTHCRMAECLKTLDHLILKVQYRPPNHTVLSL